MACISVRVSTTLFQVWLFFTGIFIVFLQVLKALLVFISEKLSSTPSSHPTLRILSKRVQSSLTTLLSPKHRALFSDPLPARDVAFSLAKLCIGMKVSFAVFFVMLFAPSF